MKKLIQKDSSSGLPQCQDGWASIYNHIKWIKGKLADYLQLKTERLSKAKKKTFLILFSLLFGGCSTTLMLYSFLHPENPVSAQSITFPKYTLIQGVKPRIRDSLITRKEYERINQFKHYLEHLQADASGKKMYDSLMQARPHLLDSIHVVDSIFQTQ